MGWEFDETNDDVQITDDAVLSVPNADWTVGGWVRLHNGNAGTVFKYFFSHDDPGTTPSLNLFIGEATHPSEANNLNVEANATKIVASDFGTSTAWQNVIATTLPATPR